MIASTTLGAGSPDWDPPACQGPVGPAGPAIGAWYQLDPVLTDGAWTGQRLTLGRAADARTWHLQLDAERGRPDEVSASCPLAMNRRRGAVRLRTVAPASFAPV